MERNSLFKNTVYNIVYMIINLIFPLVSAAYVARILQPDGIGSVAYAQNITSYFVSLAQLGIPTYGVREIAKVRVSKERLNDTSSELLLINFCSTTVALLFYYIFVGVGNIFFEDRVLFLCYGIIIVFNYINVDWFFQGIEEYGYIMVRSLGVKCLMFFSLILFVHNQNDYIIYAVINCLAVGGNNVFNIIHLRKYVNFHIHGLELKRHIIPLTILAISIFLSSLYSKVDITMLGSMCSKQVTGYYTYAHKIPEMIITVCIAVTGVFLPRLSYYYTNDKDEFYRLLDLGIKILWFLTVPTAVAFYLLASKIIVVIFGIRFSPAIFTARLFTVLIIVKSFGNLLCYQLVICTGNERKRLPAFFSAAVLNIVFNKLLIPHFAQNGAAVASIISELVVNSIQFFAMKKILTISLNKKAFLQALGSAAGMGIVIYMILKSPLSDLPQLICSVMSGVCTYLILNLIFRNEIMVQSLYKFNELMKRRS